MSVSILFDHQFENIAQRYARTLLTLACIEISGLLVSLVILLL
jgi:hypothetical protein